MVVHPCRDIIGTQLAGAVGHGYRLTPKLMGAQMPKIKRNVPQIDSAIKGPKMVFQVDATPGLNLAVLGGGKASWRLRYRPSRGAGKRWHTIGDARTITLAQATLKSRELMAALQLEGVDPKAKNDRPDGLTLDALFAEWMEKHSKVKKRTWHHDASVYRAHISNRLGDRTASEITRKEIIAALGEISSEIGGLQVNRAHTLISSMYTWAVSMELVENHPATKIPKFAVETERTRVWTHDELRKLWHALGAIVDGTAKGPISITLARTIQLLVLTGQRRGEVVGAAVAEIAGEVWTIPASRMKAGKAHTIPLAPMALGIVTASLADRPGALQVFPGKGGAPMDPHSVTRAMSRLAVSLGIEGATVHDIRRTVASEMGRLRIPESVISRVLAHTLDGITSRVYNQHAYLEEKRAALTAWESELARIVG
jgi:integrase